MDLAGSERVWRSGAAEGGPEHQPLAAGAGRRQALRARQPHVPFRNSRLTYLLQDSLGRGSKTAMVVQVGRSDPHQDVQ